MLDAPFQLQERKIGGKPFYWFIFPIPDDKRNEWMKPDERDSKKPKDWIDSVVVRVREDKLDNILECTEHQIGDKAVYRNINYGRTELWDCVDDYTDECEVIGEGVFAKDIKIHRYNMKFYTGDYKGKEVKFSVGTHGHETDFRESALWTGFCRNFDTSEIKPVSKPEPSEKDKKASKKATKSKKPPKPVEKLPEEPPKEPALVEPALDTKMLLNDSYFFTRGMYKKADSCPKMWMEVKKGDKICGVEVDESQIGSMKFDAKKSIEECLKKHPGKKVVETKFNGHRGILEVYKGFGALFSESGRQDKTLPFAVSKLAGDYFSGKLGDKPKIAVNEIILDGEMFLKECINDDGKSIVPTIADQTSAIKGEHPELFDRCKFAYKVFDVIRMNGVDVSNLPLTERKALLKTLFPKNVSEKLSDLVELKDSTGKKITTTKNISLERVKETQLSSVDAIAKKYCESTYGKGHEGLVLKDPASQYNWHKTNKKGKFVSDDSGWWKVKEALDVDVSVLQACLGNWTESSISNRELLRYNNLKLFVCDDEDCDNPMYVASTSSGASGSPISEGGREGWNTNIHTPLVELLKEGIATPSATKNFRSLEEIEKAIAEKKIKDDLPEELDELLGDPPYKNEEGKVGFPECIDIPKHKFIVEVVSNDINKTKGKFTLGGPPLVVRVRQDKTAPNDVAYLQKLYGHEIGIEE